jgi:hypothetical protein
MLEKYCYTITGYTKDNEKVLTYKSLFIEYVIKEFIEKYPNFEGKADLIKYKSLILSDDLYSPDNYYREFIEEFNSIEEVKDYLKNI